MTSGAAFIGVLTPIMVAVLGIIGTIWAKRLSKRQDEAGARKIEAEATSIEVKTAREIASDLKALLAEQRTDYESKLATTRSELAAVADRQKVVELRQHMLLAALAAHAPWDEAAWASLKAKYPEYPPPPPIDAEGRIMMRGGDPLDDED